MTTPVVPVLPVLGRRTRNAIISVVIVLIVLCCACSFCSGGYYIIPWIQARIAEITTPIVVQQPQTVPQQPQTQPQIPQTVPQQPQTQPQIPQTQPPASGQTVPNADGSVHIFVLNPEGGDQMQNRHPAVYSQTQVSGTPVRYIIDVPDGYFAIVGGFTVDSTSNGVYQGLGPGHYERTVTDGFVEIVRATWAKAEWDFRIGEAVQYNWAHQNVDQGPIQ